MILDHRCIAILNKVVLSSSHVSSAELMEELNVSKRTIYYDVEKINDWLMISGLETMEYVRSAGFYLKNTLKAKIREKLQQLDRQRHYEFSPQERIAWIAILVLTREKGIFLHDLLEKLNVSRSTLLADIKQLKEQLIYFHVSLRSHRSSGYSIFGEEQNKRKVLVYYLSQVITSSSWIELLSQIQLTIHDDGTLSSKLINKNDVNMIDTILTESEQFVGVRYTDEVIQTLSVHLILLIKRFTQGKHIQMDPVEKTVICRTKEYKAAGFICEKIETVYSIFVPDDEVYYIATYLLGAKVSEYEPGDVENSDLANLKNIIKLMVDDFQKYACIVFKKRPDLERNLFIHLKPAYFRVKYGIELANPLTESLTAKYNDLLVLTRKVVHHFEYVLGKPIPNDEVAYIAMHFGGWIDKEGVNVQTRQKAIVVCANGIGTSRISQKQIEDLIPSVDVVRALSIREYEKTDLSGIDFVISTTPVTEKNIPLFIVNPILNHTEKTSLLKQIQAASEPENTENIDAVMGIIQKHADIKSQNALYQELKTYFQMKKEAEGKVKRKPMLNELITHDKIQFMDYTESWQHSIRIASKPLLEDGVIVEGYVDTMIDNITTLGPYIVIAPGIALPHARPEAGVKRIGMSFLQLKQSCSFSEKPEHQVNLIFVLAAIDNETHLKALSQLSKMLSDGANVEKLMNTNSASEVLAIIKRYSND